MSVLTLQGVSKSFGSFCAINNLNLELSGGEALILTGPAGSGKTMVLDLISGRIHPAQGKILFGKKNITSLPSYKVAALGIARTFQRPALYTELTVFDNVLIGAHLTGTWNMAGAFHGFFAPCVRLEEEDIRNWSAQCLEITGLSGKAKSLAGSLNPGEQRLLDLARALAQKPRLLLLDEPTKGLNPEEIGFTQKAMSLLSGSEASFLITCQQASEIARLDIGISTTVFHLQQASPAPNYDDIGELA